MWCRSKTPLKTAKPKSYGYGNAALKPRGNPRRTPRDLPVFLSHYCDMDEGRGVSLNGGHSDIFRYEGIVRSLEKSKPTNRPDCAHVRAAFRLLNRAKVSESTKARIRACISRKNKALGCGVNSSKKDELEVDRLIDSEAFEETRELIEFLEEVEDARSTPEDDTVEDIRSKLAEALFNLRDKRGSIQQEKEITVDSYKTRSLASLVYSVLDEIDILLSDNGSADG